MVLEWLAMVNVVLVLFNAIPGYPLDGGRILRAIIWSRTGNLRKATYITTRVGVAFSWVLIGLGVVFLFEGAWNAFVFFHRHLSQGRRGVRLHPYALPEVLGGVRVGDIMTRDPVCIPDHTPLNIAVDDFFLAKNHVAYPVIGSEGISAACSGSKQLKQLPREKWPYTAAGDVAVSNETAGASIDAAEPAERAMRRLLSAGQDRLAVLDSGKVVGVVTRDDVLHFITIHTELETNGAEK